MSHPSKDWLLRYLDPLEGATIVGVRVTGDPELGDFPVLVVKPRKGAVPQDLFDQIAQDPTLSDEERKQASEGIVALEIARDEEGNGPGFLYGLHRPPTTARTR